MVESARLKSTRGSVEWYTPPHIIKAARDVLGAIDLDPATSLYAQTYGVEARRFYSLEAGEDGLELPWSGRVWLNPPYKNVRPWIDRMVNAWSSQEIEAGLLLINANTETRWFSTLWPHAICFIHGRLKFWRPSGTDAPEITTSAPHGNAVVYFGGDLLRFAHVFSRFGSVIWPAVDSFSQRYLNPRELDTLVSARHFTPHAPITTKKDKSP